jgi:hypothetical protein
MDFADAFAQVKAELGAASRQSKAMIKLGEEEQLANWRAQLTPEECESLKPSTLRAAIPKPSGPPCGRVDCYQPPF